MNREERKKIYLLLSQYYPQAKQLKSSATLTAWGLILENFTYEDVKRKVLSYATRNKFFPDISDITGDLPVIEGPAEEPAYKPAREAWEERWQEHVERLKQQEAASGGPCQIRSLWVPDKEAGENMMEGLFLRRHYPEDCAGCRRMRVSGDCTQQIITTRIDREREQCLILKAHGGEGHQSVVLKRYWRELCPLCSAAKCFWYQGMRMIEEDAH